MTLRNFISAFAIPASLASLSTPAHAQEDTNQVEISGFTRLSLHGDNQTPVFPEAWVTATYENCRIDVAYDITSFGTETQNFNDRIAVADAQCDFDDGWSVSAGIQRPFEFTPSGIDFQNGIAQGIFGPDLHIKGGIIGVEIVKNISINEVTELNLESFIGTRDVKITRFGSITGPGVDGTIILAGFNLQHDFEDAQLGGGYNFTTYGRGPDGQNLQEHFGFVTYQTPINDNINLTVIGEVLHQRFGNADGSNEENFVPIMLTKFDGALNETFGWVAATGLNDDDFVIEGYLTIQEGPFALQAGGGSRNDDFQPQIALRYNF